MLFVDSKVDSSCVFYQSCSVVFLFGVDTFATETLGAQHRKAQSPFGAFLSSSS